MEFALRDGQTPSYSGSISGLVGVVGDILVFTAPPLPGVPPGSAQQQTPKLFRLIRISIDGVATAAAFLLVQLIKRSTLDTAGTGAAVVSAAHDPGNAQPAGTVVTSYTAAPTPGTIVGTPLRSKQLFVLAVGTPGPIVPITWDFGARPSQAPKLIAGGTGNICLAIGATLAGAAYNIDYEFTEDNATT